MANEFEPRRVTVRDALSWFVSAAGLIRRRPHYYILPVLPVIAFPDGFVNYFVLIPVYFLLIFTVQIGLSEAVDHNKPLLAGVIWRQLKQCLVLNSRLLAGVLLLRGVVLLMILMGYTPPLVEQVSAKPGPLWVEYIHEITVCAMIILIFFQLMHGWFRHALSLFHELPTSLAQQLSRKASLLNYFVLWQMAMSILLLHLLAFFMPLWVEFTIKSVILLILPPYLYVAYRHIFLGKRQNAPVPVKAPITVGVPSHG